MRSLLQFKSHFFNIVQTQHLKLCNLSMDRVQTKHNRLHEQFLTSNLDKVEGESAREKEIMSEAVES